MYPILFDLGPATIYSLWLFIAIGFVISSFVLTKLAKRSRLKLDFMLQNGVKIAAFVLFVSRFTFIVLNPGLFFGIERPVYKTLFSLISFWDKGLSLWGGLIGFFIIFAFLAKKYDQPIKKWLDIIAVALITGMIVGKIGAFLDGASYGRETSMPWGITFQSAVVKYAVPVHPTQVYALVYLIGILIFLKIKSPRWISQNEGLTFDVSVILYSFFRFLEEFFRGDDVVTFFSFIRLPQVMALIAFGYFALRLYKQKPEFFHKTLRSLRKFLFVKSAP